MKEILKQLKIEVERNKDIAKGLTLQGLDERAACRRNQADRLENIYDALIDHQVKWRAILRQY